MRNDLHLRYYHHIPLQGAATALTEFRTLSEARKSPPKCGQPSTMWNTRIDPTAISVQEVGTFILLQTARNSTKGASAEFTA